MNTQLEAKVRVNHYKETLEERIVDSSRSRSAVLDIIAHKASFMIAHKS
jgi:hypothetical protein